MPQLRHRWWFKYMRFFNKVIGWLGGNETLPAPGSKAETQFLQGYLEGRLSADGNLGLLQCGANDGVSVDPVRSFILRHPDSVKAVLVEPLPDIFAKLQVNYMDQKHVTNLNLAIGPEESIELYRIKPEYSSKYRGITASGVTSYNYDFVLEKARKQLRIGGVPPRERVESLRQRCCTISQIIDEYIGILGEEPFVQVDAEGFDDEVIYTIDFNRHRPIAINYEMKHLGEIKHLRLKEFLVLHGYQIIRWSKSDEIAIRS